MKLNIFKILLKENVVMTFDLDSILHMIDYEFRNRITKVIKDGNTLNFYDDLNIKIFSATINDKGGCIIEPPPFSTNHLLKSKRKEFEGRNKKLCY